ncbi:MAG: type II secretion system protein [Candidatus Firestonebacteria bacterium]
MVVVKLNKKGLTFIELIISLVIIGIMASVALPLAEVTYKRTKEIELRRNLREIRLAIDKYKEYYEKDLAGPKILGGSGYPQALEELLKRKLLRKIPKDSMTGKEWGTRSFSDGYDSLISNKLDVYDVFTLSDDIALDGTKYNTW